VLEVNGQDVLGQRIGEVASRVRARGDRVTLLLWNAGTDPQCSPEVRFSQQLLMCNRNTETVRIVALCLP
jgi:hypothetical protein